MVKSSDGAARIGLLGITAMPGKIFRLGISSRAILSHFLNILYLDTRLNVDNYSCGTATGAFRNILEVFSCKKHAIMRR